KYQTYMPARSWLRMLEIVRQMIAFGMERAGPVWGLAHVYMFDRCEWNVSLFHALEEHLLGLRRPLVRGLDRSHAVIPREDKRGNGLPTGGGGDILFAHVIV